MYYIKQLDSVRAIAVILVIIWHWVPRNAIIENLHTGALGVNIFFVLSGFLITKILLENRCKAEYSGSSKASLLKNFYARRMLRIFPIYYLAIVLALLLNHRFSMGITKNEVLSNLTFTSNFFIYLNQSWPLSSLHFWSLAVEEQFYLAWPLLMLFWPKKYLVPVMFLAIAAGLASQMVMMDHQFGHLPTITCLDCFGGGGLLAYGCVYQPQYLKKEYRLLSFLSVGGVVALIIGWQLDLYFNCTRFIHAVLSSWVIAHLLVYQEKKSLLVSMLGNRWLISIGKVSYGIYLYHILYQYVAAEFWYTYVFDFYLPYINKQLEPWIFLVVHFAVLYFIALLSWKYIEKPILSFKKRFRYPAVAGKIKMPLAEAS